MLLEAGFDNSGGALDELAGTLFRLSDDDRGRLAIAIEVPGGAIVETFAALGLAIRYSWLVCATMLAEAWEPLQRRDHRSLKTLSGIAAVTKRSRKRLSVEMRTGCNRRLRTAAHYWIDNAVKRDAHWKARYAQQGLPGPAAIATCHG